MSRLTAFALATVTLLALGACQSRKHSTAAPPVSGSAAAPSTTPKRDVMTPEEEARFNDTQPERMPLAVGPLPASAPREEREQRLTELMLGQTPAERLPEDSTPAGREYDPKLFERLTTVRVERLTGLNTDSAL